MRIPVNNYTISCPFNKKGNRWKAGFHTGVDLISDDLNIYSPINGKVFQTGYDISYGNYIVLKDEYGNLHWLCHLNKRLIKYNQDVKENEIVGEMGMTGNATGVHLHYEIRKRCNCYGKVYNPLEYIKDHKIKAYQYLKIAYTGSIENDFALVAYKNEKEEKQFWVNINNLNEEKNTLIIKDTGAREYDKVLIEIETRDNPIQFWVLEKDLI